MNFAFTMNEGNVITFETPNETTVVSSNPKVVSVKLGANTVTLTGLLVGESDVSLKNSTTSYLVKITVAPKPIE